LETLASQTADDFRAVFRHSPVWRAKYEGFLRNVAVAMGNSSNPRMLEPLEKLTFHPSGVIAKTAQRAAANLREKTAQAKAPPDTAPVLRELL
jgi:epoxyqueuosine reductase